MIAKMIQRSVVPFAAVCALFVVSVQPAEAGLMHNAGTTPGSAYIDYANSGLFDNVIPLEFRSGGSWFFGGSAVAIAPDVVLFSAHQALPTDTNPNVLYDGYSVNFTSNFFQPGPEYFDAIDVVINPNYNDIGSGPDLALAFFEPGSFAVDPLTLYSGPHVVGTAYDLAGFGQYGTPSTGLQGYDGNRRTGTSLLTSIDSPADYLTTRFLSPAESGFQVLGIAGTPGDSGGGWFIDVNGEMQLAGITSGGSNFFGYGTLTRATYFTPETLAWINSEIDSHAVPEPSSAALLLVGGAVGAYRRRMRKSI